MTDAPSRLRGRDRRFLRGLGVGLDPAVRVGKDGLTAAVLHAIEREIAARELIKVRLLESAGGDRKAVAAEIAERSGTELVQVLGRTLLLWRRNEEEPGIELPR